MTGLSIQAPTAPAAFDHGQRVRMVIADRCAMVIASNQTQDGVWWYRVRYVADNGVLVTVDMAEFELEALH